MNLSDYVSGLKDPIRPFGSEFDVLPFYALVGSRLAGFLGDREIATKTWLPKGPLPMFLRRGSKDEPLSARELAGVTPEFVELRRNKLDEVRGKLTPLQQKIWRYFVPRKLADFFYATNSEKPGKPIDRVFFDLDRGKGITAVQAQQAAMLLAELIVRDGFPKPFCCWTGNSFHLYILLEKPRPAEYYEERFQFSKNDPIATFTGKWAAEIRKQVSFAVEGGHEKVPNVLAIDPSQTPSGKLARVPLGSLHMSDAKTVNGVSIPLELKMLNDKKLVGELGEYTPARVVKELGALARRLPIVFES
ncbi:hypothetical protein HYS54_00945 [Candidatus Micrarchaeota archaeon]|nr:hypothetical protein [Candidatus Micrarchaeota archaeon]